MDYTIAMNFITWTMIIWIWMGYGFIKNCESEIDNPTLDDETMINIESWIQDYNSRSFAGRVAFTITMGARMMAFIFKGRD